MKLSEITKKIPLNISEKNDSVRKPPKAIIIVIIAAIIILAFSDLSVFKPKNQKNNSKTDEKISNTDSAEYIQQTESRLEETLQKINGAGKVTVFINLDSGGEKVLAADKKTKENIKETDENSDKDYETEENIVLSGQSSTQGPYITEELFPKPSGILVIAEGAGNEKIRLEIYESVKAIFGLPANRIKVTS